MRGLGFGYGVEIEKESALDVMANILEMDITKSLNRPFVAQIAWSIKDKTTSFRRAVKVHRSPP
jgi:hypothetical protein